MVSAAKTMTSEAGGTARQIGLATLTGLVVANMIGAGVFTTSGFAMGDLGSPVYVLAAWIAGGVIALLGALSYGALSRLIPLSGGEYVFLSRGIHPLVGFIAGWVSLLAGFTGAIAYSAITFEAYLAPLLGEETLRPKILATGVILAAVLIHGLRVGGGAAIQNLAVIAKLSLLSGFVFFAFLWSEPAAWGGVTAYQDAEAVSFSITAFATTLMWVSFSYSGFNAAVYIAGEVDHSSARVPRAMIYGTLITLVVYLLLNTIFVFAPSPESIAFQQDVAAIAARALGGDGLAIFVRVIIVIALFTSVSAMIMIGPRVYAQMAEDGLMPKILRFKGETPVVSIIMQAVLAIVAVWIAGLQELLSYLGFTLGLSAALTVASVFVLARKQADKGFRLPGYPWAPAGFVMFTMLFSILAAVRNPWEMFAALLTIASAIIVYVVIHRRRPAGRWQRDDDSPFRGPGD
jgi:amino acid transporter